MAVLLALPGGEASADDGEPPSFQGRRTPFAILKPPQTAPAAPLHTLKGGATTLRRFRGKVVLLNVWATWCPACLHEMPTLAKIQARLGGDGFTVVAVSVDAGGARDVAPYLARLGIAGLPVYLDPAGRLAEALGVGEGLPWSFVIGRDGMVRGYVRGAADWDSPDARALIGHYTGQIPR